MAAPKAVRGVAFGLALVLSAALGAAVGSATGEEDEWACPADRIGHSIFELSEGGGADSQQGALMLLAPILAADGQRSEAEFADALASSTGPDRFEVDSGKVYIDDRVEAQIALVRLSDGTWSVGNLTQCGPPVPAELASPYPTPDSTASPTP